MTSRVSGSKTNLVDGQERYQGGQDFIAADFASRTMRWTGPIILLYVLFHLADLTIGSANPDYIAGDVYNNVIYSFERWPVALFYVITMFFLALHIYHGAWSLFQSLGWQNPKFNSWRRIFAIVFAALIFVGNSAIVLAVWTGAVS